MTTANRKKLSEIAFKSPHHCDAVNHIEIVDAQLAALINGLHAEKYSEAIAVLDAIEARFPVIREKLLMFARKQTIR